MEELTPSHPLWVMRVETFKRHVRTASVEELIYVGLLAGPPLTKSDALATELCKIARDELASRTVKATPRNG